MLIQGRLCENLKFHKSVNTPPPPIKKCEEDTVHNLLGFLLLLANSCFINIIWLDYNIKIITMNVLNCSLIILSKDVLIVGL